MLIRTIYKKKGGVVEEDASALSFAQERMAAARFQMVGG